MSILLPHLDVDNFDLDDFSQDQAMSHHLPEKSIVHEIPLAILSMIGNIDPNEPTLDDTRLAVPIAEQGSKLHGCHYVQGDAAVALTKIDDCKWLYHGATSDSYLLRQVVDDVDSARKIVDRPAIISGLLCHFESLPTTPLVPPHQTSFRDIGILPDQTVARTMCKIAFEGAFRIVFCIHQPTFFTALDWLYAGGPHVYNYEEVQFLPLLYATLAVGYLCMSDNASKRKGYGEVHIRSEGYIMVLNPYQTW